jgi:hypothetical protein
MSAFTLRFALCAVLAAPAPASANGFLDFLLGKRDLQVITNTDVTPAGRQRPAPTKTAPHYYVAANAGFRDFGGAVGGITEPPTVDVLKALTAELAKRGYLPATDRSPPPTLLLFFTWGTLNVDYEFSMDPDLPARPRNRQQILRFLGGAKVGIKDDFFDPLTAPITGLTLLDYDASELYDISAEDLYVTIVSAYDLESVRQKKRQLLWTTRIASVSRGFDFPEALPGMVAIGGAHFGRETAKPVWKTASEQFKPDVQLGELQLVEYLNGAKLPIVDATKAGKKKTGEKKFSPRRKPAEESTDAPPRE